MAYIGNNSLPFDPTRTSVAPRDADRFSGNGSTTSFTLTRSVSLATDIEVFVENVQQEPITAYDVNGTSLNFTGAPPSGTNNVYVVYRNFQSGAQVTMPDGSVTYSKLANNLRIFTTDNLVPNGSTVAFTLSEAPADANTVMVTVDGIVQRAPVHYTTSGSTITFASAPAASSNVHVRHLGFRTSATVTQLAANSFISQPNIASPTISSPDFSGITYFDSSSQIVRGNTSTSLPYEVEIHGTGDVAMRLKSTGGGTGDDDAAFVLEAYDTGEATVYFRREDGNLTESYIYREGNSNDLRFAANATVGIILADGGTLKFNSGYGSVANAYGCRAWVNFNGTGTVAIRGSGNVSSITDSGVGSYIVNLATAMPDTNYAAEMSTTTNASGGLNAWYSDVTTTSTITVGTYSIAGGGAGAYRDTSQVSIAVFR